jgi:hypothetical protein
MQPPHVFSKLPEVTTKTIDEAILNLMRQQLYARQLCPGQAGLKGLCMQGGKGQDEVNQSPPPNTQQKISLIHSRGG